MCNLESLKIDLKELNEGLTMLHFNLGDAYFESLDEDEIKRGSVSVSLNVRRTENYFELDLLDVAWFIYEFIALNIPAKHVHTPGKCNAAMIKVLEEHSATRSSGENEEAAVDPRWNGLEKLKTIIKD